MRGIESPSAVNTSPVEARQSRYEILRLFPEAGRFPIMPTAEQSCKLRHRSKSRGALRRRESQDAVKRVAMSVIKSPPTIIRVPRSRTPGGYKTGIFLQYWTLSG